MTGYTVTRQEQTTGRLPDGSLGEVVRVHYMTTGQDATGYVDVPVREYNAARVRELLADRVAEHAAVAQLGDTQ